MALLFIMSPDTPLAKSGAAMAGSQAHDVEATDGCPGCTDHYWVIAMLILITSAQNFTGAAQVVSARLSGLEFGLALGCAWFCPGSG